MKVVLFSLIACVILVSYTSPAFAEFDALVLLETNSGNITIELFPNDAPKHVENFLRLSESGFYDGTLFHRVIPGFMIQGGDPNTKDLSLKSQWGTGGPDNFTEAEFNDIKHNRGIVSMARSADLDSAGSQFFIVHQDSNFLDQQYTVFGRIVTEESFTTLDKIANVETGDKDIPTNIDDVRIIKASIVNRIVTANLIELPEPERTQTSIQFAEEQVFESGTLGVKFTVPQGWLLQEPLKTSVSSPDVVAMGPKTGTLPAAITLTIIHTGGLTLDQLVDEKLVQLQPLIEEGTIQLESQSTLTINGRDAQNMFFEGFFSSPTGIDFNVAFMETMIYTPEKLYSFSLVNDNPTAFADQISTLRETTESFEVIPIVLSDVVVDKMDSDVEVYTGKDMTKEEFLTMAAENQEQYDKEQGGGCLIATAAYGSEMAPQVQFLREIRDGKIMATESGTAFMTGFNQFYYSFSPAVADYERENPMFKEAVKLTLTPLLTSLAILNYVDIDTEQEMLGYGIGVILLNIGMYFVAPAAVIIAIKNRRK